MNRPGSSGEPDAKHPRSRSELPGRLAKRRELARTASRPARSAFPRENRWNQVQARPHLDMGAWHNHGPPTTNTSFTHSARSHLFYRAQSLPNP